MKGLTIFGFSMTLFVFFTIILIVSCFLIAYTYVIFPGILALLAHNRKLTTSENFNYDFSSKVSIIIAAYNEEDVIEKKLLSIVESDYSIENIEVLIGSDSSTDKTCEIVKGLQKKYPFIRLFEFKSRRGKPAVINDLVLNASNDILILTDANVLFEKSMIGKLQKHFSNKEIGLVGANILNIGLRKDGISIQEKSYIERENLIKYREGLLWGCMMGPFGGCFALRRELFEKIPEGFLVDDFFIAMKVLEKKHKCINDLQALCYEDVSNDIQQEYKRKSRISAGNFQNLNHFKHMLFHPFTPAGFCFFSHKFLRWITPFLLLLSLFSLLKMSYYDSIYLYLFAAEILLLCTPFVDWFLRKIGLHLRVLRFISYFSYMNLALLKGFFRYVRGIDSGVWTPTKRN
jgi:cellulose synthase/poly-beta-1,6-N-acetylglucosamine synthase-like glycosyltransferase